MSKQPPREAPTGQPYRTRYLKLKSVLHDRPTRLPAFPFYFDRLRAALDSRRRLGLLHIAVANLDLVESLYGWQVFDQILSRAARVLQQALGNELPHDTLLSLERVAGEGFVLFVLDQPGGQEVTAAYLDGIGERISARLQAAFGGEEFSGLGPELVFRSGHAMFSMDPFYRFERRVYAALDDARGFHDDRERRRELSWGEELQKIIRESSLHAVFQPVVDLQSRSLLGHEAFVRGPKDSVFEMPQAMFSLSHRVGVAVELDRLCRETALRHSKVMLKRGKLFLNMLPADPGDPELGGGAEQLIGDHKVKPADLILEFSERAAGVDPATLISCLQRHKSLGFGVALDDVGTGGGSREIVEQARPDYLKLDVSLVHDVHENLIKQELLHSLIQLARQVDAAVIAEGIEREEEAQALIEAGTRYGQGYLFAFPAAAGRSGKVRRARSRDHGG